MIIITTYNKQNEEETILIWKICGVQWDVSHGTTGMKLNCK